LGTGTLIDVVVEAVGHLLWQIRRHIMALFNLKGRLRYLILIVVVALVAVGATVTVFQIRENHRKAEAERRKAEAELAAKRQAELEAQRQAEQEAKVRAELHDIVSKNDDFAVCRIRTIHFRRDEVPNDRSLDLMGHTLRDMAEHFGCGEPKSFLNRSVAYDAGVGMLEEFGLACRITRRDFPNSTLWLPTAKSANAMGKTVFESRAQMLSNVAGEYQWKLIMGCREFGKMESIVNIPEGIKMEFSWKWAPTEFGQRAGLKGSSEHAQAYFRKAGENYSLQKLYIPSN
jgi:hypothetical protein